MVVICGECGEKIVVDADIADGQHVLCPACGKNSWGIRGEGPFSGVIFLHDIRDFCDF